MSILLGHKSDLEPIICAVCGRRAKPWGVCGKAGLPIAWVCDDPTCLPLANGLYHMSDKAIDRYEDRAISEAGSKTFDAIAEAILTAMWSKGVRSLEEMDGDKFKAVSDAAQAAPELRRAYEDFLRAYGDSVRHQLTTDIAPF